MFDVLDVSVCPKGQSKWVSLHRAYQATKERTIPQQERDLTSFQNLSQPIGQLLPLFIAPPA